MFEDRQNIHERISQIEKYVLRLGEASSSLLNRKKNLFCGNHGIFIIAV
jgi:hypothetical protein